MFREMRRKKQQLSEEECINILNSNTHGVLALSNNKDYPYALPISYVYSEGSLYFHCAKEGHKLDIIRENNKVSFCIVDQDQIVPEEYTTYFKSIIIFGKAKILEVPEEIYSAIEKLSIKYSPDDTIENRDLTIKQALDRLCMVEIKIEHMTGKQAIELV